MRINTGWLKSKIILICSINFHLIYLLQVSRIQTEGAKLKVISGVLLSSKVCDKSSASVFVSCILFELDVGDLKSFIFLWWVGPGFVIPTVLFLTMYRLLHRFELCAQDDKFVPEPTFTCNNSTEYFFCLFSSLLEVVQCTGCAN